MRENFDYVTMEAYSADMAEHTERAVGIIDSLKRRAEKAERLVAELILAAGGIIRIKYPQLIHDDIELTTYRDEEDMSYVWTASRRSPSRPPSPVSLDRELDADAGGSHQAKNRHGQDDNRNEEPEYTGLPHQQRGEE